MRRLRCCMAAMAALLLTSCGEQPQPLVATLEFELHTPDDSPPYVTGTTNLPEGTKLAIGLDEERPGGLSFSATCEVSADGTFRSPPLGESLAELPGRYLLSVVMPVLPTQSEAVRQRLGKQGELLNGPLVRQTGYGATLRSEQKVVLGGEAGIEAQRQRAAQDVVKLESLFDDLWAEHAAVQQVATGLDTTMSPASNPVWQDYVDRITPRMEKHGERLAELETRNNVPLLRALYVLLVGTIQTVNQSDSYTYDQLTREFTSQRSRAFESLQQIREFAGLPPRAPENSPRPIVELPDMKRPVSVDPEGPPPPPLPLDEADGAEPAPE